MKRLWIILALAAMFSGCKKDAAVQMGTINVWVNPFTLIDEDLSGSKASASQAVTRIDAALFDNAGTCVASVNQDTSSGVAFGNVSFTVPNGSYTLVVIGHKSAASATITSATAVSFANDKLSDTYSATRAITVSGGVGQNLSMQLSRCVSMFVIRATDAVPAGVATIQTVFSAGGVTLNPTTGFAPNNTGRTSATTIPASRVGTTNLGVNSYLLLNTDPQNVNVTVNVLDSTSATMYSRTFTNVPFRRGHRISAIGPLFSVDNAGTFTFDNTWIEDTISF